MKYQNADGFFEEFVSILKVSFIASDGKQGTLPHCSWHLDQGNTELNELIKYLKVKAKIEA